MVEQVTLPDGLKEAAQRAHDALKAKWEREKEDKPDAPVFDYSIDLVCTDDMAKKISWVLAEIGIPRDSQKWRRYAHIPKRR